MTYTDPDCFGACKPTAMKTDDATPSAPFEDTWIDNSVGLWNDTAGRPLHAHGGGMYTEDGKFYFVGVGRMTYDRPYFDAF